MIELIIKYLKIKYNKIFAKNSYLRICNYSYFMRYSFYLK